MSPANFKELCEQVAISVRHLRYLLEQIEWHIPKATVWAFGSRIKWSHRPESDLDLAVLCDKETARKGILKLNDALEESDLPFKVQILDFNRLLENMQENIKKNYLVLYQPQEKALPEGWKETTLGEVAERANDQWLPGDPEQKYIGLEHINQGDLQINGFGCSSALQSNKFYFKQGDILFGKLRPYFRKVWKASFDGVCSTDIWVIRAKEGYDQNFLFYFMANPLLINKSTGASTGSKMPRADWDFLKDTEWLLPPLSEQKAIAAILSSFDDKIELLRRQNRTLESIARMIFKEWFVKFNFPVEFEVKSEKLKVNSSTGLPEGWRIEKLENLIDVKDGTHDSPKPANTGYHLITSRHLNQTGLDFNNAYFISKSDYEAINKRSKVDRYDILISMIGTVGLLYFVLDEKVDFAIKNIGLFKTSQRPEIAEYIYLFLSSSEGKQYIQANMAGTTQSYVTLEILRGILLIVPSENILRRFKETIELIFQKYYNNNSQIQSLSKLRDTILPKLMKGEIRVKDTEPFSKEKIK